MLSIDRGVIESARQAFLSQRAIIDANLAQLNGWLNGGAQAGSGSGTGSGGKTIGRPVGSGRPLGRSHRKNVAAPVPAADAVATATQPVKTQTAAQLSAMRANARKARLAAKRRREAKLKQQTMTASA
jgi:hypothetical protein